MARKSGKGYYVDGLFVAAGSAPDRRSQAVPGDAGEASRSDFKRASQALQTLGEALLALRADAFARLALPEDLREAIAEARKISARGGKRRQLQFIGRLMRQQDAATLEAIRAAVQAPR